jgi:hypothetical protein
MTRAARARRRQQKFTQKPALFDAKGKPVVTDIKIGTGNRQGELRVVPFVSPIGAGASLRLKGVQIIELVEWGSGNADYYGFGEEEGFRSRHRTRGRDSG